MSFFRERCPSPGVPFIHLSKSPVDKLPSRFPSRVPMEIDTCLQSLFYLSFRVPSKGALPPGSLHRAPTERDVPPPEPLSTTSQSLRWVSPLQVAQMSTMKRDACLQNLPFITYKVPSKGVPPPLHPGSPNRAPTERQRCSIATALLQLILKVPSRWTLLPRSPNRAPIWRGTHPRTFFHT